MQLVAIAVALGGLFGSTRARFHSSQSGDRDESKLTESRCGGMVTSTIIRGAWYLPERQQLDLLFTSGRRYVYSEVPMAIASRFAEAQSKGQFYNLEIRNTFPCREIGGPRERSAA